MLLPDERHLYCGCKLKIPVLLFGVSHNSNLRNLIAIGIFVVIDGAQMCPKMMQGALENL